MRWRVDLAKHASMFIRKNHIPKEYIFSVVADAIKNFQGEIISVDIRKMKGEWEGFYRIRKGKWRIIKENPPRTSLRITSFADMTRKILMQML